MKLEKAEKRDKKRHKSKNGMKVDNKSIFVIVGTLKNKAEKAKKEE